MLVTVSCCQCLHIAAHCRTGYNQLHRLRPVLRSLSADTNTTMVQAFASSRLDYCNSLLYGIRDYSQYRKPLHVWSRALEWSTTRRQLHWLPVLQRIEFKVICFFYQSLTVAWCRSQTAVSCVPPMFQHASFHRCVLGSVTEVSLLPARACGTLFR